MTCKIDVINKRILALRTRLKELYARKKQIIADGKKKSRGELRCEQAFALAKMGKTKKEIAVLMNVKPGTVHSHLCEAIKKRTHDKFPKWWENHRETWLPMFEDNIAISKTIPAANIRPRAFWPWRDSQHDGKSWRDYAP